MGVEVLLVEEGRAVARMEISDSHRNFLGMVHGGAIFSLADVAFSAAANSWGTRAMAIHITIDYLAAPGDTPYLEAEVRKTGRAGRATTECRCATPRVRSSPCSPAGPTRPKKIWPKAQHIPEPLRLTCRRRGPFSSHAPVPIHISNRTRLEKDNCVFGHVSQQ